MRAALRRRQPLATALAIALLAAAAPGAAAAPPAATLLPIQGVARDADGALLTSGDIVARIYADSIGGAALYDSGTEFAGAIAQGIFDVVAGAGVPLLLDQEARYYLELDAAGIEIIGDAAGGRWPFYPGGGSHARPDLDARIAALEAAVTPEPAAHARHSPPAAADGATALRQAHGTSPDVHGLIGLSKVSGSSATHDATGNLLAQPVGLRAAGAMVVELGPYYLFAPGADPVIRSVRDVPGDQGRAVRIRWRRDLRERPYQAADPDARITGYTLYRRVGPGQARPLRVAQNSPSARSLETNGALPEALALPPGDWDVLTSVPATLDTAYQTVVPTLCDSTAAGICWSTFVVRAITDRVGTFHDSDTDSGYSVDNLAPGVPQGLLVQAGTGGTALTWQPSTAPDFQHFRVYRDGDPDFTPGPATLVHATIATQWTDPALGSYTWKVTAVDFNGNESAPASGTTTVSVVDDVPRALGFAAISPNPFRRSLALAVDVPAGAGEVELSVFDVAGRRVRLLASGARAAGRHHFAWDGRTDTGVRAAAGVYVMRLAGAGRALTRRVTLLP